jgi:hypothetical protein
VTIRQLLPIKLRMLQTAADLEAVLPSRKGEMPLGFHCVVRNITN